MIGREACKQSVGNRTDAIDIKLDVRLDVDSFGSAIARCPEVPAVDGFGEVAPRGRCDVVAIGTVVIDMGPFARAEVEDRQLEGSLVNTNISRFEIAVEDALVVQGLYRPANLDAPNEGLHRRVTGVVEQVCVKAPTLVEVAGEVQLAVDFTIVIGTDKVGTIEGGEEHKLVLKPHTSDVIGVRTQDFQGIGFAIRTIDGFVDIPEFAPGEVDEQFEVAEKSAEWMRRLHGMSLPRSRKLREWGGTPRSTQCDLMYAHGSLEWLVRVGLEAGRRVFPRKRWWSMDTCALRIRTLDLYNHPIVVGPRRACLWHMLTFSLAVKCFGTR